LFFDIALLFVFTPGVSAEDGNRLNPLHSILQKYNEDDFIVFKLVDGDRSRCYMSKLIVVLI
jgi:hypothetical protein